MECGCCASAHHKKRRAWNLTPLSPGSKQAARGKTHKKHGWAESEYVVCCWSCFCVLPPSNPACPAYKLSLTCIQHQHFCCSHAHYWTWHKHAHHGVSTAAIEDTNPKPCTCAVVEPQRAIDATLLEGFAANWQFSIASLFTCSVTQPVTMEMSCVSCWSAYTAAYSSRGEHSWLRHTSHAIRSTPLNQRRNKEH